MNQLRFSCTLFCTAVSLLLYSCGGGETKTDADVVTADSTASTATTEMAPQSTIVNTAQNMVIVKHKVANFTKWLPSYEAHDSMKLANGLHNYVVGRSVKDSNTLLVALKADDMAKAKAFGKDPSLKQAMQKSGVVGPPTISYYTAVFQDTAQLSTDVRSLTTFNVKDWEEWRMAFESNRQMRIDNGLADRVYGHDPDDNHKAFLVVAIIDSAKGNAFFNSTQMKENRAKAGVIGQPERFTFHVAKRY